MPDTQQFSQWMQMILSFGNLCIMFYAFKKFLSKPQDTLTEKVQKLESQIAALEIKMQENLRAVDRSLKLGNEEFQIMKETSKVLQTCMLALIDFELSYCSHTGYEANTEDLLKAKKTLHDFLSTK